jgi:hypothetical protein
MLFFVNLFKKKEIICSILNFNSRSCSTLLNEDFNLLFNHGTKQWEIRKEKLKKEEEFEEQQEEEKEVEKQIEKEIQNNKEKNILFTLKKMQLELDELKLVVATNIKNNNNQLNSEKDLISISLFEQQFLKVFNSVTDERTAYLTRSFEMDPLCIAMLKQFSRDKGNSQKLILSKAVFYYIFSSCFPKEEEFKKYLTSLNNKELNKLYLEKIDFSIY